jgi:hypothetical protein
MSDPSTCCACGTCATAAGILPSPPVADPVSFAHDAIKERMLARIGSTEINGARPLAALGTRDDSDPAIALIDAVAGSLHILAWNAARLYDDGTIARTEDRDALVDLTRLLGYEPRPALAATTMLSFTLDNFDASPKVATVPRGTKVASVPGQNEKPQTFETDADLDARAEWNALQPVQKKRLQAISKATTFLVTDGAVTAAKSGDLVLVAMDGSQTDWLCARVGKVTPNPNPPDQPPQTRIDLTSPVVLTVAAGVTIAPPANTVVILGQHAAAFGAGAPDLTLMSTDVRKSQLPAGSAADAPLPTEWLNFTMPLGTATGGPVDLDAVYADAMQGRLVVFSRTVREFIIDRDATGGTIDRGGNLGFRTITTTQIGQITGVIEHTRVGFGLSSKVSQIEVDGIDLSDDGDSFRNWVRETAIYIETAREALLVTDDDVAISAVASDSVLVAGKVALPIGRRVVLTGEQWSGSGVTGPVVAEVATVRLCAASGADTLLSFERNIANTYRSTKLQLLANCVSASHGATPTGGAELIGSGNAATASPRFQLKGSPLTYVPAGNPRGYAPAIEVRVSDRLYDEQPTLFGLDSTDRAYTVKPVRGGTFEVQFAGRLATGTNNVTALYRVGGGAVGNLAAGRLTTAMAPILGVGAVANPIPADGGSDAETIDDMRGAAPQSIRTLDRVVSLVDFAAFARGFGGIGKAIATELDVGMRSVVCLTIATTDLKPPVPGSDLVAALGAALGLAMAPGRTVRIEGFTDLTARLTVAMAVDPALRRSDVEAAVRTALGRQFGRAARNFGEALFRSAVLAAVQGVDGVLAATLPVFALPNGPPENAGRLLCPAPAVVGGAFRQAGLLSIDPNQVQFAEMQP